MPTLGTRFTTLTRAAVALAVSILSGVTAGMALARRPLEPARVRVQPWR